MRVLYKRIAIGLCVVGALIEAGDQLFKQIEAKENQEDRHWCKVAKEALQDKLPTTALTSFANIHNPDLCPEFDTKVNEAQRLQRERNRDVEGLLQEGPKL